MSEAMVVQFSTSSVLPCEQSILPMEGYRSDCSLDDVVLVLDAAVS
jgi:hypothetical protein